MKNDFYVYMLFDVDGIPRYVGKGRGQRWLDHERSDCSNQLKRAFVRKTLAKLGKIPKQKIQENLTELTAFTLEVELIAAIGRIDLNTGPLTNMSCGGTGGDFGHLIKQAKAAWTAEQRQEFSKTYSAVTKQYWASLSDRERANQINKMVSASLLARKRIIVENPDYDKQRAIKIKAGHARRTPAEKAAAAQKQLESWPSEKRSEVTRNWHATRTPEERSATLKRGWDKLTPEQRRKRIGVGSIWRSEQVCRQQASLTIEQKERRAQRARKLGANTYWANNGKDTKRFSQDSALPVGWVRGRIKWGRKSRIHQEEVNLHV